ncbi:type II toxin-antitoxin system RelE family toxin [Stygiolobus caldivivus]|uniref:Cytotoxic translational repressor of toxin-antitoxin stability system n=1 Tax=Stygiolobus caldivivus TaxID=2824673 RepID=A0A8D5ZIX9_9CREN|nr:type II toxin-antitoxin system RelE/ParE family toxin [Stygiolobus caldivivus]BCU69795.1 cytotoxic translational repressor of toxin-antitoxin stability system [Stygiolobus caldivivus]
MRKAKSYQELVDHIANKYNDKVAMLIFEKIELIQNDPFKYPREKLGKDIYGNPMFSIEVTGDIRVLYSVDTKNCIVFIWENGSHKEVYGH